MPHRPHPRYTPVPPEQLEIRRLLSGSEWFSWSRDGNNDLAPDDPIEEPAYVPGPFDDPTPIGGDSPGGDWHDHLPDGNPTGPEPPDAEGGNPPFEPLGPAPFGPAGPG